MTREVARLEPEKITLILSAVRTHDHFDEDGRTDKEATEAMESAIADYHAALKKNKIITRSMHAFAVTGAATAAGAVFVPLLGIGGGIIGLGSFVLDRLAQNKQPEPEVAAMFYDARKHFGCK